LRIIYFFERVVRGRRAVLRLRYRKASATTPRLVGIVGFLRMRAKAVATHHLLGARDNHRARRGSISRCVRKASMRSRSTAALNPGRRIGSTTISTSMPAKPSSRSVWIPPRSKRSNLLSAAGVTTTSISLLVPAASRPTEPNMPARVLPRASSCGRNSRKTSMARARLINLNLAQI
jgi:hypothetical protein